MAVVAAAAVSFRLDDLSSHANYTLKQLNSTQAELLKLKNS